MSVRIVLPDQLVELTDGRREVELNGRAPTLRDALAQLATRHPAVHDSLVTEPGDVRPHINLFVDGSDAQWTGGLDTELPEGCEILVLRAVSGG